MKQFAHIWNACLAALVMLSVVTMQAQTPAPISKWGKTAQGTAWPIKVTATTTAGTAQIGTGAARPTGWATIRGGFDSTLQATASQAVVVSGQMELVGGGGVSAYTWLRYALTFQDSSTLNYKNTDTAAWVSPKAHSGYEFDPISGAGTMANGSGGGTGAQGTAWLVNNGSWSSTNSNGGGPFSDVKNAPRNAEAIAGTYNWAISVQSINDTTNEVRWYLVEATNKYWFGGTVQTKSTTKKFNGVNFGFNSDIEAKQVNFKSVTAGLGSPITVPVAPWQAFYVDQWGATALGKAWPVKNDTTYLVGDATLGTGAAKPTGWATIRGAFGDPVVLVSGKAMTVTGKMELVGGGGVSAYTWLRYALTYQDSSTLNYKNTDTAQWVSTKGHYGYEFDPITGAGTMANGSGGGTGAQGTAWLINNGNWNSTNSNGGGPFSDVKNAPRNAEAVAGVYDWAISVQAVNDTTNEVRWYLKEKNNKYWFGGSVQTKATTKKFNGVCFGFGSDIEAKQVKLTEVKVDMTSPLVVPTAPWQAFYVDQWGATAQGKAWPVKNDTTYLVGDATLGTGAAKPTGWATIRGAFGDPVALIPGKAMTVTGQMEFIGGGGVSAYTWLRYALTFQDSSTLSYKNTDTAQWVSTKGHYGYEFDPISGAGTMANGSGGGTGAQGTAWLVNNGSWSSTNSNGGGPFSDVKNAPRNAEAIAGTYNWAISVQAVNDTTNEVRWYLVEKNNKYWFGGTVQTKATTKKFNGVCFGFNSDMEAKQVKLTEVKVDMTSPLVVPTAPWQAFYVDQWGATAQGKAWPVKNDTTYLVGDATLGTGAAKPTGWATIRGAFGDPVVLVSGKAMTVTGKMELVGGGGVSAYTWLRYALTYQDSSTLSYKNTDTAQWVSTKGHSGYAFHPISGAGTMSNGTGGQGTMWSVNNGSWSSTYSNNGGPLTDVKNAPRNAEAIASIYNWAISVQPINDTTNEVRWYLIEKDNKYWFGGTIQTKATTKKFNGVCFGFNSDIEAKQVKITEVKVDMTPPITVPPAPWQDYYATDFGFIGGKLGGWKFTPGDVDGNASVAGSATNTTPTAVRIGLGDPLAFSPGKALQITGSVEFVGGAFTTAGAFRFGLFQTDSAGTLIKTSVDSTRWNGKETNAYGYLFVAPSGTNGATAWNAGTGTWGGVSNGTWSLTTNTANYVIGSDVQTPVNAVPTAGVYKFTITVAPQNNGSNYVSYKLAKSDNSYVWQGEKKYDAHAPVATSKFNSLMFQLANGTATTGMKFADVKVAQISSPTGVGTVEQSMVPKEYALGQNYPNPFNPSTKIMYDVPKQSRVSIMVFDILGRSVATLVNGEHAPGSYSTVWNAASAVSGVYFYRIEAANADGSSGFTAVRKLMLMK